MTPAQPTLRTYVWRASLIGAVAAAILFFGFSRGRAWLGTNPRQPLSGPPRIQVATPFLALPGSSLVCSYDVVFNGEKSLFARYQSIHPPQKVVEQFEGRYGTPLPPASQRGPDSAAQAKDLTEATMVSVVAPAYAVAGARDADGCTLGMVAFGDPTTGGSTYFLGRGKATPQGWRHGDVPGEDVSGVRPLRSRRILCVDGLGGIPSRLLVYEGWGAISDTVEHFATAMPKAGWTRNRDVEDVIQKRLPGTFLSFLRGTRRVMVYIARDEGTNQVRTAVVHTIKGWLPEGRGV